jgi:hypothetical protein
MGRKSYFSVGVGMQLGRRGTVGRDIRAVNPHVEDVNELTLTTHLTARRKHTFLKKAPSVSCPSEAAISGWQWDRLVSDSRNTKTRKV